MKEMARQASMAALVLEQVFSTALLAGVPLAIDLSRTEDEGALREVGRMRQVDLSAADLVRRSAGEKIDTLQSEYSRSVAQVRQLSDDNAALQRAVDEARAALDAAQRDKGSLVRRLEAASAGGAAESREAAAASEALRARVAELQTELEDARRATVAAEGAETVRVSQTRQFRMIKDMLQRKNKQLIELRSKLAKYEPDVEGLVDSEEERPLEPKREA